MAEGRVVPSDLFPLVFAFLKENHFEGAARAFGKAAGVTEQDPNAASLLDVFNYWLKSPEAKKRKAFPNGPPAKKAKKDFSSSSSSSSEDEMPLARKPVLGNKPGSATKAAVKAAPVEAESSSEDSSDSSDSEQDRKKPAKNGRDLQVKKGPLKVKLPKKTSSSSSSDSSSSEDEAPKRLPPKPEAIKKAGKSSWKPEKVAKGIPRIINGTADGSSSSSEDSDTRKATLAKTAPKRAPLSRPEAAGPPLSKGKAVTQQNSSSSSEDSSDSSEDEKSASKPKPGQYSAVPPPLALEPKKSKGPGVSCKKIDSSGKKEQMLKKTAVEQPVAKQPSRPKSSALSPKGESSSQSGSDSSSEEEDKKVLIKQPAKPAAAKGITKPAQVKPADSSCDSSDPDSSEEEVPVKPALKKANKAGSCSGKSKPGAETTKALSRAKTPAPKPSSSDSESSSSEEERSQPLSNSAGRTPRGLKAADRKQAADASSSGSSDSSSDDEEPEKGGDGRKGAKSSRQSSKQKPKASNTPVGKSPAAKPSKVAGVTKCHESSLDHRAVNRGLKNKKRKREDEQVLETPELKKSKTKPKTPHSFPKMKRQSSPFRRVRAEEIEVDSRVANNSFDAKKGAAGDWGAKANDVLKFTKGKSFRHEKTKKKRGSYCGGTISTQINSIKFESD